MNRQEKKNQQLWSKFDCQFFVIRLRISLLLNCSAKDCLKKVAAIQWFTLISRSVWPRSSTG